MLSAISYMRISHACRCNRDDCILLCSRHKKTPVEKSFGSRVAGRNSRAGDASSGANATVTLRRNPVAEGTRETAEAVKA